MNLFVNGRLILLNPSQFGGREVARRIQQMWKASLLSQCFESLLSVGHGSGVAPDNGRTQHLLVFIYTYQAMHLIRDTDRLDVFCVYSGFCQYRLCGQFQVFPPVSGVLLCPAGLHCDNFRFSLGEEGRRYTLAAFRIYQTRFYRRATYVIT